MHLDAKGRQVYVHSIEPVCENTIEPDRQCLISVSENSVKVLHDGFLGAVDFYQVFGVD